MRLLTPALAALAMLATPALANDIAFDGNWKQQGFLRLSPNTYELGGSFIGIGSQDSVSMIYRPVPRGHWQADKASWEWAVSQSVPATDLTVKGVDDRNISLYFVFVDADQAEKLANASARRIFGNRSMRTLVYVWGGDYPRGTVLDSPFQPGRTMMVPLRKAGTGDFRESVDLAADYRRAFGSEPGVLVGLAVSADSDDTNTAVTARLENLDLR